MPSFDAILLYAGVLAGFVITTLIAAHVIGPRKKTAVKQMPYESGMDPVGDARQPFDVKFYLVAILFLVFDVELLFLYPWAVAAYLDEARKQNAELISGQVGPDSQGYCIAPTLVINPDAELRLSREEVVGPVVNLVRVADGEEALRLANDSDFVLTASVWTGDLTQALSYTERLQAGTVWVNSHTLIDANLPFGGMKQSGTGRDFGPDWLDGWCETKSVCVRY